MLQSTMLAIKGAQLVVDCAGITAGKNALIMCDEARWLEGEALAGVCHAVGARPLLVDLSPQVAWYYANLKRPRLPRHLVAAMNATDNERTSTSAARGSGPTEGGGAARSGRYPFQARFSHFSGRNGCRNASTELGEVLFRSSGADDGCQRWCPYDR